MAAVAAVQGGKLLAIIDDIEGPFIQFEGTVEHYTLEAWEAVKATAAKLEAEAAVLFTSAQADVAAAVAPVKAAAAQVDIQL